MILEALKALFIGIVEGITEWLPISSTGHMILVDEFVKLDVSDNSSRSSSWSSMLGAIMAVILLYFHKLTPSRRRKRTLKSAARGACGAWSRSAASRRLSLACSSMTG